MEIFWLDDPDILFKEYNQVLPTKDQTSHQQLNALTRLVLLITLVLLIIQFDFWYVFLIASLILILLLSAFILDIKNYGENYSSEEYKMNPPKVNKINKVNKNSSEDFTGTTPISFETKNEHVNIYSQPINPGTVKVQTKANKVFQSSYQDIDEMSDKVSRLPKQNFNDQEKQTSRVTYENVASMAGNSAAFESARHSGSAGYLNSDHSGISSLRNLEKSKEYAVNDHYRRENLRREKLVDSYNKKREKDQRHYLESGGYEPPVMQNKHYFRGDENRPRTYNGYVIL
jgi:hypothetical protein